VSALERRYGGLKGKTVELIEVDSEHRDPQREPAQVVVPGPELAPVRVDRFDASHVGGDPLSDLVGGDVERHARLVVVGPLDDALLDVRGGVLRRQPSLREAHAGRGRPGQAVEAEGSPVLAAPVPGDQVPAAAEVHERVGLDLAAALGAVAAPVGEADALEVAAGRRDQRQVLWVDGGAAERGGDRRRAQRRHAPAQVGRQDLFELDQRAHRGLLDPGHRRAGGGEEADGDRDRLLVVQQQRRHGRAGAQPVPARRTGQRLDRVAQLAQAVDVAPDRAPGDREPVGQLGAGPVAARLQQGKQLQEPARGGRQGCRIVANNEDRS